MVIRVFETYISFWLGCITFMNGIARVWSEKDTSYYPYPDFVNPNIYYKMYWKDAENVISDMDEFSALYISHHGCVWSASDTEEARGGGGDDDYWYLGGTQRFRANSAYTLYGVLKGQADRGCTKDSYINSFFTTSGVENFAYPLGVDTSYVDSNCGNERGSKDRALMDTSSIDFHTDVVLGKNRKKRRRLDEGDDEEEEEEEDEREDEKEEEQRDYGYSYGTGCDLNLNYVTDTFGGGYCDGSQYIETTDYLEDFNEEINTIQCIKVYDKQEDQSAYYSNAYSILANSKSCSRKLYNRACSDPYGILSQYEANLQKAMNLASKGVKWTTRKKFPYTSISLSFLTVGLALIYYGQKIIPANSSKKSEKNVELPNLTKKAESSEENAEASAGDGDESINPKFNVEMQESELVRQPSMLSVVSKGISSVAQSVKETFAVPDEETNNKDDESVRSGVLSSRESAEDIHSPFYVEDTKPTSKTKRLITRISKTFSRNKM